MAKRVLTETERLVVEETAVAAGHMDTRAMALICDVLSQHAGEQKLSALDALEYAGRFFRALPGVYRVARANDAAAHAQIIPWPEHEAIKILDELVTGIRARALRVAEALGFEKARPEWATWWAESLTISMAESFEEQIRAVSDLPELAAREDKQGETTLRLCSEALVRGAAQVVGDRWEK